MSDELWGPIDLRQWRRVPHMSGALAGEHDVKAGRAVSFLGNLHEVPARPGDLHLPALALLKDPDHGSDRPVVVIQVEVGQLAFAGIRFIEGGNGLCLLGELEIVDEDDPRWTAAVDSCAPGRRRPPH